MRFFNTSETLHVMGGAEGVRTEGLETFDEEALMATIPLFRMLYTGSEPTSFSATLNVLKRAVKAYASLRDQAIAELRTLGVAFENGKKTASFGMIVDWVARDGTTTSAERGPRAPDRSLAPRLLFARREREVQRISIGRSSMSHSWSCAVLFDG